jgi:hypothetical protein
VIEHLVFFKLKADAPQAAGDKIVAGLRSLKSEIPEIVDLTAGWNFTERSQGHQIGLVVRLKDRKGLDAYQVHPKHQAVVQTLVKPHVENVLALDYEF